MYIYHIFYTIKSKVFPTFWVIKANLMWTVLTTNNCSSLIWNHFSPQALPNRLLSLDQMDIRVSSFGVIWFRVEYWLVNGTNAIHKSLHFDIRYMPMPTRWFPNIIVTALFASQMGTNRKYFHVTCYFPMSILIRNEKGIQNSIRFSERNHRLAVWRVLDVISLRISERKED